jgi:hypothetical protein
MTIAYLRIASSVSLSLETVSILPLCQVRRKAHRLESIRGPASCSRHFCIADERFAHALKGGFMSLLLLGWRLGENELILR